MIINTKQRQVEQEAKRRASLTQAQRDLEDRVTILTKFEFISRLTQAERVAIYSLENQDVNIKVWLEMFRLAEEIDLDNQDTIDGVNMLEAGGVLAVGRAAEILK